MIQKNNRQWILSSRPQGRVTEDNFTMQEGPIPEPGDGQVLVRNLYLSFDPTYRGQMMDRPNYVPPIAIGDVMRGSSAGVVVKSNHPGFHQGDQVRGRGGWQDYFIADGNQDYFGFGKIPEGATLTQSLSIFGVTGLTAYFGLLDLGRPQPGDTVLVSGAAGATGSVVGQIARLKGCRVLGIAGGEEKCAWLIAQAGFDAAIDYKNEPVPRRIRELCPDGINVYFDNVGGAILEAALGSLAQRARVVLCGGISGYDTDTPVPGPRNLGMLIGTRSRMEGFLVSDYHPQFPQAIVEMSDWIRAGKLSYQEDLQEGFEKAPRTFMRLFSGENRGKQLLKIWHAEVSVRPSARA